MKIFLFSSPYQYYADNLIPLANYFSKMKHKVFSSYRLDIEGQEYSMLEPGRTVNYSKDLLSIKPDIGILTQTYWFRDKSLANLFKQRNMKFYVIDHAPPMMRYTQKNGDLSHLYRQEYNNENAYFSYGQETVNIMTEVGYPGDNISIGSSRIEETLKKIKNKKDGFVLFDTSNKMEDDRLVKRFVKFVKNNQDRVFIIKEHSRSPKLFRPALRYSNVVLGNNFEEHKLYEYSHFIFSFPSSAMLIPAILNKKIFGLYDDHFCIEAREYFKKYSNCIFPLEENAAPDYRKFLARNIVYKENESTNERIYKYIIQNGGR